VLALDQVARPQAGSERHVDAPQLALSLLR
jgi:hypothetical protein